MKKFYMYITIKEFIEIGGTMVKGKKVYERDDNSFKHVGFYKNFDSDGDMLHGYMDGMSIHLGRVKHYVKVQVTPSSMTISEEVDPEYVTTVNVLTGSKHVQPTHQVIDTAFDEGATYHLVFEGSEDECIEYNRTHGDSDHEIRPVPKPEVIGSPIKANTIDWTNLEQVIEEAVRMVRRNNKMFIVVYNIEHSDYQIVDINKFTRDRMKDDPSYETKIVLTKDRDYENSLNTLVKIVED